jgi:hypothetical protein
MDGMSQVSDTLADKRHQKAELEHLRVFFMRWCEMHRMAAANDRETPAAAQALTEQALKLKEFYG